MSTDDTAASRADLVMTVGIRQSEQIALDIRQEFADAYYDPTRRRGITNVRGVLAWAQVRDRVAWSIAYDVARGWEVSSAEVDLFRRIEQLLESRRERRQREREQAS